MPKREDEYYLNGQKVRTCPHGHWVGVYCDQCHEFRQKVGDIFADVAWPGNPILTNSDKTGGDT